MRYYAYLCIRQRATKQAVALSRVLLQAIYSRTLNWERSLFRNPEFSQSSASPLYKEILQILQKLQKVESKTKEFILFFCRDGVTSRLLSQSYGKSRAEQMPGGGKKNMKKVLLRTPEFQNLQKMFQKKAKCLSVRRQFMAVCEILFTFAANSGNAGTLARHGCGRGCLRCQAKRWTNRQLYWNAGLGGDVSHVAIIRQGGSDREILINTNYTK